MTTRSKRSAKSSGVEALLGQDGEMLRRLMQEALQQVLEAEMTEAVGAAPGRADKGAAGLSRRLLQPRPGDSHREARAAGAERPGRPVSTELFARYQRSEKGAGERVGEMYVQGVSTRKVKAITEELCGHTFSASTISRINASLDGVLSRFAERRLDEAYPYLVLDARYEKVRLDGVIQSQAVLVAIGINWDGRRCVLGVELSNRESRSSWTNFVTGLKVRGLHGVEFVVSDDHAGLKRAVAELLPEAVWQRCYVHFLRNALDYLPRKADDDCRQELRWLYDRRDLKEAQQDLQAWLLRWAQRYPRLTDWVEAHIGETAELLPATASAPQAPEIDQPARTAQRGDQAPHPSGPHLPKSSQLPAAGPGALRRDPRRVARRPPLPQYGLPQGTEEGPAASRCLKNIDLDLSHDTEFAQLDAHNR